MSITESQIMHLDGLMPAERSDYVTAKEAERIMGNNFLGTEKIKQVFGLDMRERDIPIIRFTREELEKAKELGQMLILKPGIDNQGNEIGIDWLWDRAVAKDHRGDVLDRSFSWARSETPGKKNISDCLKEETLKAEWVLVSNGLVPGTDNDMSFSGKKLDRLCDYAASIINGQEMLTSSQQLKEAIDEYREYLEMPLVRQKDVSFMSLKIFKLVPSALDLIYYSLLLERGLDHRLLRDGQSSMSSTVRAAGKSIYVGRPNPNEQGVNESGLYVRECYPGVCKKGTGLVMARPASLI